MKRFTMYLLSVITCAIISACNKTEELNISDEMYSIVYISGSGHNNVSGSSFISEYRYLQGGFRRYKHSFEDKEHTFASNQLEIEYEKAQGYDTITDESVVIRYQIGVREINHKPKAYIVLWRNSVTARSGATVASSWGIGEDTYYVKTNLPQTIITKLYPEFRGEYHYFTPKKIVFNDSLKVDSPKFYEDIRIE